METIPLLPLTGLLSTFWHMFDTQCQPICAVHVQHFVFLLYSQLTVKQAPTSRQPS